MNQAEKLILDEIRGLSLYGLDQILDFIRFIKHKESEKTKKNILMQYDLNYELVLMNRRELSHLEEEFQNYKELYQYEE